MKFTASRLSEGNKIFPAEIHIDSTGLTVKIPGLFSGQSRHLDFQQIGEVSVNAPLVGYSTISFYTAGTMVAAHGFTSSEVKEIKTAIEKGKTGELASNSNYESESKSGDTIIAEAHAEKIEYELDKQKKHDNAQKPWMNDSNFKSKNSVQSISFPNDVEDIEKTIEKIIAAAIENVREVLNGDFDKDYVSSNTPFSEELGFINNCIEKSEDGIKKLKRKDETEHPKIRLIISDLEENLINLKDKWLPQFISYKDKTKKNRLRYMAIVIGGFILLVIWYNLRK